MHARGRGWRGDAFEYSLKKILEKRFRREIGRIEQEKGRRIGVGRVEEGKGFPLQGGQREDRGRGGGGRRQG